MLLSEKKHSAFLRHAKGIRAGTLLLLTIASQRVKTAQLAVIFGSLLIFSFPASAHAGFLSNMLNFFGYSAQKETEESSFAFIRETQASVVVPALDSAHNSEGQQRSGAADEWDLSFMYDSGLIAPLNPQGTISDESANGQIFIYTVKPGDNPATIAKSFGVSLNTLLWANNLTNPRSIKAGDALIILPISGVQVEVIKGDTVDAIAKKYKGNLEDILQYNGLSPDEPLTLGSTLIIPDGELSWTAADQGVARQRLPSYEGYYIRPLQGGRRTRGIHGFNGVDLAASRGTPVSASAGGTVIISRGSSWNGGYGKYLVISHSNGTQTLYAHLDRVYITAGQHVEQGAIVGTLGSTGNSTGPHLHFEVRGGRNPF